MTLWEEAGSTGHSLYRKAKGRRVLDLLQSGAAVSLSTDEHRSVAEVFKELNELERALVHYRAGGDIAGIRSLYMISPTTEKHAFGPRVATAILEASVLNGEWSPVLDYCANETSAKAITEFLGTAGGKANSWVLRAGVVRAFSDSELLVRADNRKIKIPASDFLKRVLITEGFGWLDNIHVSVAGGALERAGRIVDCLQFYENVQSNPATSPDDSNFAAARWIKCKQRQADHEKEHGKAKAAEKLKAEVERRAKELSLDIRSLVEFPKPIHDMVTKRRSVAATPEATKADSPVVSAVPLVPTQIQSEVKANRPQLSGGVGDYKFEYDRLSGKFNITKGLDTVALRLQKGTCTSADVEITVNGLQFFAKEWQLEIDLTHLDTDRCFDVRLAKLGISLRFVVDVSS